MYLTFLMVLICLLEPSIDINPKTKPLAFVIKEGRRSPTRPRCSINSKTRKIWKPNNVLDLLLCINDIPGPHSPCENHLNQGSYQFETSNVCYLYYTTILPKVDVEEACFNLGLQILMFETTTEQTWLQNQLAANSLYYTIWTGGRRLNNLWQWYDNRRGFSIATINTSRIFNPSSSDDDIIFDPGPNMMTPRAQGTYHRYICETQVQQPTVPTSGHQGNAAATTTQPDSTTIDEMESTTATFSQTASYSTTTQHATTLQITPVTPSVHRNPVSYTFGKAVQPIPHMQSLQTDTLTSIIDCMVKCSIISDCALVEIENHRCNFLQQTQSSSYITCTCSNQNMTCFMKY